MISEVRTATEHDDFFYQCNLGSPLIDLVEVQENGNGVFTKYLFLMQR